MSGGGSNGEILDLNVGGSSYSTSKKFLIKDKNSLLCEWFNAVGKVPTDSRGRPFIDRDGQLFRYVLDYLRTDRLLLPEKFDERQRLLQEAKYYKIAGLVECLSKPSENGTPLPALSPATAVVAGGLLRTGKSGYITVGYQGTFSFGPQGKAAADVNFRKIMRILVCGRVSLCRDVFGETLNEGRDPDRGSSNDRYTARFYLKHNILEQAFDALAESGFRLASSCSSGTSGTVDVKPGSNVEEDRWARYTEFVFCR